MREEREEQEREREREREREGAIPYTKRCWSKYE